MEQEKLNRTLPKIILDNTPFIIDYENRWFIEYGNDRNQILFDELKDEGPYSVVDFNSVKGPGEIELQSIEDFSQMRPRIIIPNEILQKESFPGSNELEEYNERSFEHSWNIYLVNEMLGRRIAGELPHIEIAGTDFTVDWRLKELRETAAPFNVLRFSKMELSKQGTFYVCFYHTKAHNLYEPVPGIIKLPEDVVMLYIPNELQLDPIAVARQYGLKDFELLREFPLKNNLKADVKTLAESGLSKLIKQNIKNQRAAAYRPRKRNGRHL